ncbi:MAG: hypothetical protein P4L27_05375 [Ignavibacteriaceae bacterium]|nr:hypothetical protein [Ignavibacteriaceae bacterium]
MDLKKAKQLEDIKLKYAESQRHYTQVFNPYYEKYYIKKKEFISSINNAFEKYFASDGFNISKGNNTIVAKYNTLEILLRSPLPEETSIGAYLVFDLEYDKTNHKLIVKKEGSEYTSGIQISERTSPIDQIQDEINELQTRIDKINTDISNVDSIIKELDSIKIYFEFIDKNNKKLNRSRRFNTFEEILNIIFSES